MSTTSFDRNSLARWYAVEHLKTDPGVDEIYYLPTNAPEREIRFIEVNSLIGELEDNALEPIDFGVDFGRESQHKLLVLDVTPGQFERICQSSLPLPNGWSLDDAVPFRLKSDE